MRPVKRTTVINADVRKKILAHFGTASNFWRKSNLMYKLSRDVLFRAFRGDPVTVKVATEITSAWTESTHTYITRETALKILEYGIEAAKADTRVPLTAATVFDNLEKLNRSEKF